MRSRADARVPVLFVRLGASVGVVSARLVYTCGTDDPCAVWAKKERRIRPPRAFWVSFTRKTARPRCEDGVWTAQTAKEPPGWALERGWRYAHSAVGSPASNRDLPSSTSGLPPTGKSDERGSSDRRTHRDAGEVTVGGRPPDSPSRRGRHHPRPGIYNAVLRSDLWALPALGTGHRIGVQNAPAGGPSQITDHSGVSGVWRHWCHFDCFSTLHLRV